MVGTEHWTLAMVRAADGVVASRALHTTLAASYGRDTAALKREATAFFGARNRTYDEVTTWVRRDLTKLRAQVMQYRTKMRMLATFGLIHMSQPNISTTSAPVDGHAPDGEITSVSTAPEPKAESRKQSLKSKLGLGL